MCNRWTLFLSFTQLTEVGLIGGTGDDAQWRVDQEECIDVGLAPIPHRRMVECSAWGWIQKVITVTCDLAQVKLESNLAWDCFGFALLRFGIGLKKSRHPLNQSDAKPKLIVTYSHMHFPALSVGNVYSRSSRKRTPSEAEKCPQLELTAFGNV